MPRYIFTILTILASIQFSFGQGINFFEGTFEEAKAVAEAEGKLIFVDAYAVWCGPCRRMSNQVFPRQDVGDFYNENFINLKMDMESKAGRKFGKEFPVSSFPTLLFLEPDGDLIQRIVGAQRPENLIKQGQSALQKTDRIKDFQKQYNEGNREPQLVLNYIKALNKSGKPSIAIANQFLRENKDFQDTTVLKVVYESTVQSDSRIFDLFIEQKDALVSLYGAQAVEDKIEQASLATLKNALTFESDQLLLDSKNVVKNHLNTKYRAFEARADFEMAKVKKDAGLAFKAAKKIVNSSEDPVDANFTIANELYQYYPNQPKALALARKMAGKAAKAQPTFDHLYVFANLLSKEGKTRKALKQAKRAEKSLSSKDDPRKVAMIKDLIADLK